MSGKPNSKPLAKLLDLLVQWAGTIFVVLVALGVCGYVAIPLLERNNHFDENALLAGSARPTIRFVLNALQVTVVLSTVLPDQIRNDAGLTQRTR